MRMGRVSEKRATAMIGALRELAGVVEVAMLTTIMDELADLRRMVLERGER
jgi:hypothetical protein